MSQPHESIAGLAAAWATTLAAWANAAGIGGFSINGVLSAIKLVDALRRWRRTSGATLTEHIRAATRPGPLGDEP